MINSDDSDARTVPSSDNEEEEPLANPGAILLSNLSAMIHNASIRLSESSSLNARVPTTFDKSLAAKHEYLGTDFEELRGRTLHDEGSIVWLPILMELGVVLVPGQTLPFTAFYPPTVSMFREVVAKDKTFGVMCVNSGEPYGTTAEIYQYQEEDVAGFKIKAKGRQRFKLLDEKRKTPGILFGKVLILPEINLASPLSSSRFTSLDRFRHNGSVKEKLSCLDAAPTPWPSWVYRQYDIVHLGKKVTQELKNLKIDEFSSVLPTDPIDLSYWVAQCMPIDGQQRLKMLTFNTAIERLQYASEILTKGERLFCHRCGNFIADRKNVFSMSIEGPQGMYCNPSGYVHEIITLYYATGMMLVGDNPSTEYSWFPGYAWTIAQCSNCDCHMGWLFTATNAGLKPIKFWGLSRKSVSVTRKIV